jgi:hypothetical protein
MSNAKLLRLSIGLMTLLFLILVGWLIYTYQASQRAAGFRFHVFCELIMPGMDREEVSEILSQYGNFWETESSFQGDLSVVGIVFTDPMVDQQFGGKEVVLVFKNGKYLKATIPVFFSDANRPICQD